MRDDAGPAIRLEGLGRRFGEIDAVSGLSFEVPRGSLHGLVGPDGAGKTTTLRMLAGVLPPTSGDAWVDGVSIVRDPEGVKPSIAYMSQRFGLYTDLTVRENIDFYADLYGVSRSDRPARLEQLYAFSNLGRFEHRLAGQLSGGMKQKLSLCCALIHQPVILLLDEPTFGVDPISRRDLWLILHRMVAEGVTILVSTAYLDEAERCDHVSLLHQGRLIAQDRPEALQQSLPGTMVEVQVNDSRTAVQAVSGVDGVLRAAAFGSALHVRLDDLRRRESVLHRLKDAGLDPEADRVIMPSLEDVFIERVRGEP
ncbi:MAG: ATP-binding cassette domain-containing protein [Gemmatimonadales bacterium]